MYWYKKTEQQRGDTVWMCVLDISEEDGIFRRFNSSVVISLQCTRTVCLI